MQFKRHLTALALAMGSVAAFAQATVGVSWSNFQEERWKTDEAAIKAQLRNPAPNTSVPTPAVRPRSSWPTSTA